MTKEYDEKEFKKKKQPLTVSPDNLPFKIGMTIGFAFTVVLLIALLLLGIKVIILLWNWIF